MKRTIGWTLMLVIAMASGCSDKPNPPQDTGEQFVGNWVATDDSTAVMQISKDHDAFVLRFIGNARGHGFGVEPARGVYKDGKLKVARAGLTFYFGLDATTGQLETGFTPKQFRRIAPGEKLRAPEPPTLPKL